MDPDATYRIMTDPDSDIEERAVAAVDLLVWLATSGFPPSGIGQFTCADECKTHIFRALDRLNELEERHAQP